MRENLIKKRWIQYIAKKSKVAIALDILFVLLLVAIVFPQSRTYLSSVVIKYTMFQPRESKEVKYIEDENVNWVVQDLNGKLVPFNDFKGKVVFVNFWATWCPPCIAEMSGIQALYDQYHQDVVFLLVSDEDKSVVNGFLTRKGYTLPVFTHHSGTIPRELVSQSIPATFLISKKGRVVIDKKGAADWHGDRIVAIIDQLLNE